MRNNGLFKAKADSGVCRVSVMSDIHSASDAVVGDMIKKNIIDKTTVVISCGDMCGGTSRLGEDDDPIETYCAIQEAAYAFYFVQGNHDAENSRARSMRNDDGTRCYVDRKIQHTVLGTIGGVSGIVSYTGIPKPEKHIYTEDVYQQRINKVLIGRPDIFLTHQPEIDYDSAGYRPHIHLCGHHAEEEFMTSSKDGKSEYVRINADNRILQFSPVI